MPQAQLPIFPNGATAINTNLAFEKKDGKVTYFHGTMPVFVHDEHDLNTFRMITSQFYVNGNATQAEICRAFGVLPISVKRAVKKYREQGAAGFYQARNTEEQPYSQQKYCNKHKAYWIRVKRFLMLRKLWT